MSPIRKCRGFGSAVDAIIQKASEQPRLCKRHGDETGEEYTEVEENPDDCDACRRIFEGKHDNPSSEKEHVPGSKAFQKEAAETGGLFNRKPQRAPAPAQQGGGLFKNQPQQPPATVPAQQGGLFNKNPQQAPQQKPQQGGLFEGSNMTQKPQQAPQQKPQQGGLFEGSRTPIRY